MVLFEIKVILLVPLIAVLQSHDLKQPMNCSQMGLIWDLSMCKCNSIMDHEAGEAYFYNLLNLMGYFLCINNTSWGKFTFAFIYGLYVDNTGLFIIDAYIVLVQKTEKQKKTGERCPWEQCKTGVLFSIWI